MTLKLEWKEKKKRNRSAQIAPALRSLRRRDTPATPDQPAFLGKAYPKSRKGRGEKRAY